jgi:hypothetical protein
VELNLGPVADVVVEPKLMNFETEQYRFDYRGNIAGWDEIRTFEIEVRNTRDIPVKVEIKRDFPNQYWRLRASDGYEKVDMDTVKFMLALEPRSKEKFEYTLRIYQGTRQEDWQRTSRNR